MVEKAGEAPLGRAAVASIVTLVLVVLASLFIYKWSGALRVIGTVQSSGAYLGSREWWTTAGLPPALLSAARTINYLLIVWPALLLGVLIAGLVRAFVSTEILARLLGSGVLRQQLLAGAMGMPLMLCSCCIAPIFSSLRARRMELAPSLALMFSSPSLNVAALALTFMLFPLNVSIARAALAAFAVFVLPMLIQRAAGGTPVAAKLQGELCSTAPTVLVRPLQVIRHWVAASGNIALRTLPWIFLGVFASSVLSGWLAPQGQWPNPGLTVAVVAAFATLMALPTFFEIPLGLLLLQNGFPEAAAVSILFAGPIINTPSLLTMARVASPKVALAVFLGIWLTATIGGLSLSFF
ncbi:MAG: permease [Acidobacteria bacterium]|nr:permease [Acidobacteriota bacterium]